MMPCQGSDGLVSGRLVSLGRMTETTRDTNDNRVRMPRVFRRVAVAALAAALLAGMAGLAAPGVAAADSGADVPKAAAGQDRPELQKAVQAWVDAGFAGMQMRVHDQQGDWVGSAGVRKLGETAKPPTNGRFWIGSSTKTFTATLVLQLVAEGKIGLDAPVAGYLPKLGLDRRITVLMLLQHTSGLFNYTGDFNDGGSWEPGITAGGKEWVDDRFRSYRPGNWYGWPCPSRHGLRLGRTRGTPTPTTQWRCC